jgi:hypothetical protein
VAFAVQLDHHVGAQCRVLLVATDPLVQLDRRPLSGREGARVEGHKHRVQARSDRLAGALAGGGDGPLPNGIGVAGRHAEAVVGEGLAQRRPGGPELSRGGVDAAELFGELEGALGFRAVGKEPAGLPAQRVPIMPTSLLRSVLGYEQVLSEVDVELYAGPARMRLRPAA